MLHKLCYGIQHNAGMLIQQDLNKLQTEQTNNETKEGELRSSLEKRWKQQNTMIVHTIAET